MKAAGYFHDKPSQVRDVAVDSVGNIYLVGGTPSPDFSVAEGACDTSLDRGGTSAGEFRDMDVFVMKLDRDGGLIWSTFLGGPNYDRAYAVEVDGAGHVYVAGRAGEGFPTTRGAVQTRFAGDTVDPGRGYGHQEGFVNKLSSDGRSLVWSSYFGGGKGFIRDIDIDAQGNVYLGVSGVSAPLPHITPDAA